MRTIIIYRDADDYYPEVRSWLADFRRRYPDKEVEEYSPDDPKIDDLIRINELIKFPAIAALDDQNKILAQWIDDMLPKLADVAYYSADKSDDEPNSGTEYRAHNEHKVIEPLTDGDESLGD
jgi:hypothetical protein